MGRIKKVGAVEFEEAENIYKIFMRSKALEELKVISSDFSTEMSERLNNDIVETSEKLHEWWETMADKYNFESAENCQWEIDFDTYDIYLVSES